MEELNLNVRQRPYLRRKAKLKFEKSQPVQKRPRKKKRSERNDAENNKKKRRKSNKVWIDFSRTGQKKCFVNH